MFPFECKRIIEGDMDLIKLYISDGLIDRYLTTKDYSAKNSWGGMIGYILQGTHTAIVTKLNEQINFLLNRPTEFLERAEPIADFEAIYKSQHKRLNQTNLLVITHIFLAFPQTSNTSENFSSDRFQTG